MKWYQALTLTALVAAEAAMLSLPKYSKDIDRPVMNRPAYDQLNDVFQVELVDMDGDGLRDLVAINGKGQVSVAKGYGFGRFGKPSEKSREYGKSRFHIEDADNDGDPDIVVTNWLGMRGAIINDSPRLDSWTGYEPEKYTTICIGGIPVAVPLRK